MLYLLLKRLAPAALVALLAVGAVRAQTPLSDAPSPGSLVNAEENGDFRNAHTILAPYRTRVPERLWQHVVDLLQHRLETLPSIQARRQLTAAMARRLHHVAGRSERTYESGTRKSANSGVPARSDSTASGAVTEEGREPAAVSRQVSDEVYAIPFASQGNRIELTLTGRAAGTRNVRVLDAPAWMELRSNVQSVTTGKDTTATFTFGVAEDAPIGKSSSLLVAVERGGAVVAEKEIRLKVAAPPRFELLGNYPNPFSRGTTIGYQLPEPATVTLTVYDVLGRRVAEVDVGEKSPGGHEVHFDGTRLASGVYLYVLGTEDKNGDQEVRRGKMVLVR